MAVSGLDIPPLQNLSHSLPIDDLSVVLSIM
jgi:hypothetical protein